MMKNTKFKIILLISFLTLISSIQPVQAANQYSVEPGAYFRWDATKYYYYKDGLGQGNDLEYTISYYLEFNFTNWVDFGGEFLNGTIDNNGTVSDGEISHAYYYTGQPINQEWVTEILDYQGPYPVHVYLVCETEIEQTTKPDLQDLASASWLTFGEPSPNNFTLTGTFIDGDTSMEYTAKIEFNEDKVLKYVFDELITKDLGVTVIIERYIWTLTYIPGGEDEVPDNFPTADFTTNNTSGLAPLTIQFTDASVSLDGISSYNWNFGDGSINSTIQNPIHTFTTTGTYTVTLTVFDTDGDADTVTTQITVSDDVVIPDPVIPGFPLWVLLTVQIVIFAVLINRTRKKINN